MSVVDPAHLQAAELAEPPAPAGARPAPAAPAGRRAKTWKPPVSKSDVIVFLLAANMIGLVGLGIRVYRGDKPTVVTVGITQLARDYMGRLATSNVTPDQARLKTQMFLSVVQDTVRNAALKKGMIVMPRECVLAGEYSDLTGDVARAVNETLQRVVAPAAPALPPGLGVQSTPLTAPAASPSTSPAVSMSPLEGVGGVNVGP
jgi:hypothetical protein